MPSIKFVLFSESIEIPKENLTLKGVRDKMNAALVGAEPVVSGDENNINYEDHHPKSIMFLYRIYLSFLSNTRKFIKRNTNVSS